MMLETIRRVAALPVDTVKLHQLQIIKGTTLANEVARDGSSGVLSFRGLGIHEFSVEEYIDLCVEVIKIISASNPRIAIERFTSQAPAGLLVSPRWGLKNYQFTNLFHNRLKATLRL